MTQGSKVTKLLLAPKSKMAMQAEVQNVEEQGDEEQYGPQLINKLEVWKL